MQRGTATAERQRQRASGGGLSSSEKKKDVSKWANPANLESKPLKFNPIASGASLPKQSKEQKSLPRTTSSQLRAIANCLNGPSSTFKHR
jgi:hypothetical protein